MVRMVELSEVTYPDLDAILRTEKWGQTPRPIRLRSGVGYFLKYGQKKSTTPLLTYRLLNQAVKFCEILDCKCENTTNHSINAQIKQQAERKYVYHRELKF